MEHPPGGGGVRDLSEADLQLETRWLDFRSSAETAIEAVACVRCLPLAGGEGASLPDGQGFAQDHAIGGEIEGNAVLIDACGSLVRQLDAAPALWAGPEPLDHVLRRVGAKAVLAGRASRSWPSRCLRP